MTISTFFKFIKIETNLTSALPAILGFLFSYWYFGNLKFLPSLLFFIALMFVSAFVTAWNSTMDYVKATNDEYRLQHNQLSVYKIPLKTAYLTCGILIGLALILGIFLIFLTNWLLLLIGGLCVLVTIFYTFSPFAFSRMPLGEILAGLVEGFGSFWLACWVNNWNSGYLLLDWNVASGEFSIHGNLWTFLLIAFAGIGTAVFNFNIMLSDNICDLEQDIRNERFTLPYYLGKKNAIKLLHFMYWIPFALMILSIFLGTMPIFSLIVFLAIPFIKKRVDEFTKRQVKSETFPLIIQNLPIFEGLWIMGMTIACVLKMIQI
ncbi:1,4-dihydroxy-2-naphthoate octaprenyltransferase [Pilibacter termitis]|uniref:1,4-dihydroxy-2-naphthoate octaprenyltransferase n=1 Tax=Pilibacter termitis TaxID=263852 RepID=A0A1T4Q9H8_9ENTE|nr:UbiA family prenyltransferase [Pilibacter termitis]SKA00413.1 1,4-dihydroxy-2-naphthoate octaprenyltransferase [Pilibacter termitis]